MVFILNYYLKSTVIQFIIFYSKLHKYFSGYNYFLALVDDHSLLDFYRVKLVNFKQVVLIFEIKIFIIALITII